MEHLLSPALPGANKPISSSVSTPEWRYIKTEFLMGRFGSEAEGYRYYIRRGLEADGKFQEALSFG